MLGAFELLKFIELLKFYFFTLWMYIISGFTSVLSGIIVVIDSKIQLESYLRCKMQNKILLGSLCHKRHITIIVTWCTFCGVIN